MSRLTKYRDDIQAYDYIELCGGISQAVTHKLGKLEDLLQSYNVKDLEELDKLLEMATTYEELSKQIGCPLDVVAHLVMNKPFYYEDGYGRMHFIQGYELCTCSLLFGNTWEDVDIYAGENGDIEIPLSEYKKSFWIKEDKSE